MSEITLTSADIVARQQALSAAKRSYEAELDKHSYDAMAGDADAGLKVSEINAKILQLNQDMENLARAHVTAQRLEAEKVAKEARAARVKAWDEVRAQRDKTAATIADYEATLAACEKLKEQAEQEVNSFLAAIVNLDRHHGTDIAKLEDRNFSDPPLIRNAEHAKNRIDQMAYAVADPKHVFAHPDYRNAPGPLQLFNTGFAWLDLDADTQLKQVKPRRA